MTYRLPPQPPVATAGPAPLVLVRGDRGAGRTTALANGSPGGAVALACHPGMPRWDRYCAETTLAAFRAAFDEIGDPRLAATMASVGKLCVPDTYASARARSALFTDLVRLFDRLRAAAPGPVLFDDIHFAPDPESAVAAARCAGCAVVVTCPSDEVVALSTIADEVVDVAPMSAGQVRALIAGVGGRPVDLAVTESLCAALGTFAGNPGTVRQVFDHLRSAGTVVEFDGHLCLADGQIDLPPDHDLVHHVLDRSDIAARLVAVTVGAARFGVDDLPLFAAATGVTVTECGDTVDRLVAVGALDCDATGTLRIACPALGTTVVNVLGRDRITRLHASLAERLLRRDDVHGWATVADHVALAGPALPPTPALATLLTRAADRVLHANPALAARWHRAAFRHDPRDETLAEVLRLQIELGDYRTLAQTVAEGVERPGRLRPELAVAATLASVHIGQPVSTAVSDALAGEPALAYATRWFSGEAPLPVTVLGTVAVPGSTAAGQFDVVTEFERLPGYGPPTTGPLAIYRRIVRSYLHGDWSGIPSDVRSLELTGHPSTPAHSVARLLATEVYSALGDVRRGRQWFDRSGADCPFVALRTWAAMGMAYRAGDWDAARDIGWRGYGRLGSGCGLLGLRWLLVRMAFAEWEAGDTANLARLSAETTRWRESLGGVGLAATELITRALAERDYACATAAVDILRGFGSESELMRACMTAAFVADEPQPWYHEAYAIAQRLGGDPLAASVRTSMRDSGVAPPRQPSDAGVTEVEARIAALVQEGLTNRQIAATLLLSEKTVANHLTRLFAKTGCRSRLDLALARLEGRLRKEVPEP